MIEASHPAAPLQAADASAIADLVSFSALLCSAPNLLKWLVQQPRQLGFELELHQRERAKRGIGQIAFGVECETEGHLQILEVEPGDRCFLKYALIGQGAYVHQGGWPVHESTNEVEEAVVEEEAIAQLYCTAKLTLAVGADPEAIE